jgi:hypothetical protein
MTEKTGNKYVVAFPQWETGQKNLKRIKIIYDRFYGN